MKVGNLIWLTGESVSILDNKMTWVEEVLPGGDNVIRSVTITTASEVFRTPVVMLATVFFQSFADEDRACVVGAEAQKTLKLKNSFNSFIILEIF